MTLMARCLIVALSFFAIGCGKLFKKDKAPIYPYQAGLIATCTNASKALAIAKKYDGEYRVIDEEEGLVEIIGVDRETLEQEIDPKHIILQNKIYKSLAGNMDKKGVMSTSVSIKSSSRNSGHEFYFHHLGQIGGFWLPEETQGEGVTIAVVDSGVYYNHEHLAPNMFVHSGEIADNGIDDDGNGRIDDVSGWDFYNGDNDPNDDNGHGTHVAGLAAGVLGGVAPKAKIMPIKVLDEYGAGDVGTVAQGVLYAIKNGADVVNLSLGANIPGGLTADVQRLVSSVCSGNDYNSMVVTAAGNEGEDNDSITMMPSNIDSDNVISVAAVNSYDTLTVYSNYGKKSVAIAAPGGDGWSGLLSTYLPNCTEYCNDLANYASMSGTSMAAPVVSGLVALIKGKNPDLSLREVKSLVFSSGTKINELKNKVITSKVINVGRAIQ
jgi:subtilisin family serine protease